MFFPSSSSYVSKQNRLQISSQFCSFIRDAPVCFFQFHIIYVCSKIGVENHSFEKASLLRKRVDPDLEHLEMMQIWSRCGSEAVWLRILFGGQEDVFLTVFGGFPNFAWFGSRMMINNRIACAWFTSFSFAESWLSMPPILVGFANLLSACRCEMEFASVPCLQSMVRPMERESICGAQVQMLSALGALKSGSSM